MSDLEIGLGGRLVVVGVLGESASATDSFLICMRLSCRGIRAVNLGTGVTLERAAAELSRRRDAEALLFICDASVRSAVRQLAGLGEMRAAGVVQCPVFVGGTGGGSWQELRHAAARLQGFGVAQVLSDLVDAAYLLPARQVRVPEVQAVAGHRGAGFRVRAA
ncbi:hypothetical protein ABT063_48565 [Streptomyces sp. NPDC002838]|uniref:hypothetical protein n=1 Tax=Streptomyces sp. NPDC002838 TaxID=3154436 RepID=UPI0033189170